MENKLMWLVYDAKERPFMYSLAHLRKYAIRAFLCDGEITWEESKQYGCTVKKVEVTITPVKPTRP